MEDSNSLKDFKENPILDVSLIFQNTCIDQSLLENYLKFLKKSKNVGTLNKRLQRSMRKLNLLNSFSECNAEVYPGDSIDSANIIFNLKDKQQSGVNLALKYEPLKLCSIAYIRNIRNTPSITKLGLNVNWRNFAIDTEVSHNEKIWLGRHLQTTLKFRSVSENLYDIIEEKQIGGSFTISSLLGRHSLTLGSGIRSNKILSERPSDEVVNSAFAAYDKTFISYYYDNELSTLNRKRTIFGRFWVKNEFSTGKNLQAHKMYVGGTLFVFFSKLLSLENRLRLGLILPWPNTKYTINDLVHFEHIKGFKYFNQFTSLQSIPKNQEKNPGPFVTMESKLRLGRNSLSPYFYTNLTYISSSNSPSQNFRSSTGIGLQWTLGFGTFDFLYALKSFKQPGDLASEFQVFFYPSS